MPLSRTKIPGEEDDDDAPGEEAPESWDMDGFKELERRVEAEHRKLQQNPFPLDLNAFATTVSGQITDNFGNLAGNVPSGSFFAPYLDGFQTILTGLATTVPQQIYDGPLAAASPLAG